MLGNYAMLFQVRTVADAYQPRQPICYLVDGMISAPSLNLFYGAPGTLKSLLLLDMAICVASGNGWLAPLPVTTTTNLKEIAVIQSPVLWVDLDNGKRRTAERIEAFARARNLPGDAPFYYMTMPDPWFDATNTALCDLFAGLVKELQARLVTIDNLGLAVGNADENSPAMSKVMANFRKLVETTGAAVNLIHHQRKGGSGHESRKGDALRGHSSIEASLDLAMCVERYAGKPKVTLIPTKVRDFDAPTLSAYFAYTHKPGTKELETARFYGEEVELPGAKKYREIVAAVVMELQAIKVSNQPMPNNSELRTATQERLALAGVSVGTRKIGAVIRELVRKGTIIEQVGLHNTKAYSLP